MYVERDVVLNKLTQEENTVLYVLRDTLNGTQGEKLEIDANVNWDSIYRILVQQSLFHIAYNSLKAFLPQSVYPKWYATHFLLKNRIRRDINETCEVVGKIGNLSSHIAIAKGFVLSQQIYGDLYMRQYSDVDIYSDREWIYRIGVELIKQGYIFYAAHEVPKEVDIVYKSFFEDTNEVQFAKGEINHASFELKKDDKSALINADFIEECVMHKKSICINQSAIPAFDLEYAIIYLMMNAYKNYHNIWGRFYQQTLRDIYDIAACLVNCIYCDWNRIFAIATRYGIADCIAEMVQLSADVFQISLDPSIYKYTEASATDWQKTLFQVLHADERVTELVENIQEYITGDNQIQLQQDKEILLPHVLRMPINREPPKILVSQVGTDIILIDILGLPADVDHVIDLITWSNAIVNETTRRKISRIHLSSGHLQWERKERNVSASILCPENIRFSIQIQQDEIFEQKREKELLLELYVCWETTKSPFNAWVTVGWDCKPKELVIDAGL